MKYRKKPVVIEAMKLDRDYHTIYEILEWVYDLNMSTSIVGAKACVKMVLKDGGIFIKTLEGGTAALFGDYIIKDYDGEFYTCKQNIFEQTYEEVNE